MPTFLLNLQTLNPPATLALDATQSLADDVFRIGEFIVGGGDSSNLGGHPNIRY